MTSPLLPYGRQTIDDDDVRAVVDVLRSPWLTTGPAVDRFESDVRGLVGADRAVAVANGTAALHLAVLAAGIGPGDEVVVPALTFVASANCARYAGADVVFADVRDDTLTIDVDHVRSLVTDRTRAIVAVDYAGLPCDLDELLGLADAHGLTLIEDACHAPGATYRGRRVGSIAHLSTFSFHPVKHVTTGEGGMVTTNDDALADRVRRLRNHGIDTDARTRDEQGTWAYDMAELGYNYRLSDVNCALGSSQLRKLGGWIEQRRQLVRRYDEALADVDELVLPTEPDDRRSSWHLYAVRFVGVDASTRRRRAFEALRADGIGVAVHYQPVYQHSYYQKLGYRMGSCPTAETAYEGLLSLPLWPGLSPSDQDRVISGLMAAASR